MSGSTDEAQRRGLSRRGFLAGSAAIAGGGLLAGAAACQEGAEGAAGGQQSAGAVPFHGAHQAGIATRAQDRLAFAAFDLTTSDRAALRQLLQTWTDAAARMAAGKPVANDQAHPLAPPVDTGEAQGLPPSQLTITFGFGPTLFDERFGLAARRPAALADLPPLPGDELDPARCGGDLCVQACADDPQVAFHAVRNLARIARGAAVIRWFQLGFGRTSSTTTSQATPRNLMGFKDGTNNIKSDAGDVMAAQVWVGEESDQRWLRGGSYLVARRIRMLIESWDRSSLREQQRVFGRQRDSGAPLGERHEFDPVDLRARRADGAPVIPLDAHIRLASPKTNGGHKLLRRGYSYTDGIDPLTGELDAGLFFICFQKDPHEQFVRIQRKLGAHDALTEYIKHTGSAVFACPPGVQPGGYIGDRLI